MNRAILSSAILVGMILGCGGKTRTATLKPQEFQNPRPTTAPVVALPIPPKPIEPPPPPDELQPPPDAPPADTAVAAKTVPAPSTRPGNTASNASQNGKRALGGSSGTYMIVGIVVAEANGHAVYADKVLSKIDAALAGMAQDARFRDNPQAFRAAASSLVRKRVDEEIYDELEFAAAQRNNTDEEKDLASTITAIWRQRMITKAGGSLAIARQNALRDENMEFDEMVMQQYRRHMVLIYYEKHVWPRVQISADDMRRFYERNVDELFSVRPSVQFRAIKIDVNKVGDRQRAQSMAKTIQEKAKAGSDFAEMARTLNHDVGWQRRSGYMDMVDEEVPQDPSLRPGDPGYATIKRKVGKWYPKGSLALKELEAALFAAERGGVTDVIAIGDAFYVAKVEDKKAGNVQRFEDEAVQMKIRDKMRGDQRAELRRRETMRLMNASVWRIDREALETTVEMAMQKYAIWRNQ